MSGYISSGHYLSPAPSVFYDPYYASAEAYQLPLSACYTSAYMSPLTGVNDYYDHVDWDCTLAPYVDKLYWRIETGTEYEFPNNVIWERG